MTKFYFLHIFTCLDKVTAVGYDLLDPVVLPTMELRNITVQAFCNGKLSESRTTVHIQYTIINVYLTVCMLTDIFVCGDKKDSDNKVRYTTGTEPLGETC